MKSCERYELLASLVLDGEASEAEQAELKTHLETCPACRAYYEDIRRIHQTFACEEAVVPEGFAVRVMDRVRETKQDRPEENEQNKKIIPFPHWRRWTALAACCAVVMLSVWTYWRIGGRDDVVSIDPGPRTVADTGTPSIGTPSAAQESDPVPLLEEEDTGEDGAAPAEAAEPIPEESLAKSVPKDGETEGSYQPVTGSQSGREPALYSSPPPEDTAADDADALPEPETPGTDSVEPEDSGSTEPAQQPGDGLLSSPAAPAPEETPEPDGAVESPAPVESVETVETVEPIEVVGVPEPGILIAYGTAAQDWVENVLGMEWATGGSYPLTAEQYGDLLRTLDEAGELYSIVSGDGYCLMTE